nr:uncharacterized protein LOC106630336 [Zonotrichia albicollis]
MLGWVLLHPFSGIWGQSQEMDEDVGKCLAGSLSIHFLGFGDKAGKGMGQLSCYSNSIHALGQGMGIPWGRAAQLHPKAHPNIPTLSLPTSSIPRANSLKFPQTPTHLWDHPWEPSILRPGRAATHPWLLRVLCPPLREASRIPSSGVPRHGGCAQRPQGGHSARGDNDRRWHLLVPRGNSLHGNVRLCHSVALPGASVGGRGASVASQGFSLENSLLGFGTYFLLLLLLQQQQAAIPMASSARSPVGWTLRVRSISQPLAEEFHLNSSMRSQNRSRRHHKIPSPPPEGGNWEFCFPPLNFW